MPRIIPLRPLSRIVPALTIPLAIALTQAPSSRPLAEAPHAVIPRVLASTNSPFIAEPSSTAESAHVNPSLALPSTPAPPASIRHPAHARIHAKVPR